MKKLLSLVAFIGILFTSCEGDPGPPGPPGLDGGLLLGSVFEYNVTFSAANNFAELRDFPSNLEVFDTDVVLAYVLNEVDEGVDIWEPLPQTLFFQDGILLYGYNHTAGDIEFFMDGTVDLNTLDPLFTNNIIFRVAVIPADAIQGIDTSNINNILELSGDVQTIDLQ